MSIDRLLERRRQERDELLERAGKWVESLGGRVDLRGAVVFGSVARGDFNLWSDVDLLLLAADASGGPVERAERLGNRPPRVQPVVWSPSEGRKELGRGNPIAVEAVGGGIWLLGSAALLERDDEPEASPRGHCNGALPSTS